MEQFVGEQASVTDFRIKADKVRSKGHEVDDKIGKTWSDANSKARELKADAGAQLNNARSEANKGLRE